MEGMIRPSNEEIPILTDNILAALFIDSGYPGTNSILVYITEYNI